MKLVSRGSMVFLVLACIVLGGISFIVYRAYLSPTSEHARENSTLGLIDAEQKPHYIDQNGNEIRMTSFDGKLLIVNMWASWSPYTQSEMKVLAELKSEFGEFVTIRAVNRKEDISTALAYLDQIGREEGIEYIIDTTDMLYAEMGGYAMPETIVYDEVGNVLEHIRGTLSEDSLREHIKVVLER